MRSSLWTHILIGLRLPHARLWIVAWACMIGLGGVWSPVVAVDSGDTVNDTVNNTVNDIVNSNPEGEHAVRLFMAGIQNHGGASELPSELHTEPPQESYAELVARMERWGNLAVIVRLDMPEELWAADAGAVLEIAAVREAALADAQQAVLGGLAAYGVENIKTFHSTPHLALTLSDPEAMAQLMADENVLEVVEDKLEPPILNESVHLIGADYTASLFGGGTGQTIAILDTGVDRFHPALAGKVIAGACYSTNNAAQGASSFCPGGATESTALSASGACPSFISACDHGTHVAGIAAAVAPAANLVSMQVFTRITDSDSVTRCAEAGRPSPCVLAYNSDIMKALERVKALRNTHSFAAVNLSLGGGAFTAACTSDARRALITELRNTWGIIVVAGAGNDGYRNAMIAPACIPEAFSVAASDKNDVIASYSNIASFTNVIAPGSDIYGPTHTPNYVAKNGTSMATPHVAGAIAVLRGINPSLSVAQYEGQLANSGVLIADNRPANTGLSKRRVNVWQAFCGITNCDIDDFRTIFLNQTLTGNISPVGDRDYYYLVGTAGQRLTLRMNRTSGTVDPYLELFAPGGARIAFNDNGGSGSNSLINNVYLPQSGLYVILARGVTGSGQYSLNASAQAAQLNPVPRITRLSPGAATATPFGSDFWVAIYGENFMPTTAVRWNGQSRTQFYSSPGLIYIRVRGSDIGMLPAPPRLAFVSVSNPTPGGGLSNSVPFNIRFPFLGESAMLTPPTETTIETGVQTSIAISWTAPITATTWRSMQGMDLRIRNERNEVAVWVRVVEQPGATSFYRLLNAAENQSDAESEEIVREGLPGEARTLVISDTVTLHLEQSEFSGSGLTAIMTPSLTFGPNAVGTWNVEFLVDRKFEEEDEPEEGEELDLVQEDDVLGIIHIVPAGCPAAVSDVAIAGPVTGYVGESGTFTATVAPVDSTAPITYTWVPTPTQGIGTPTAVYSWTTPGIQSVSLFVENCGGFAAGIQEVAVATANVPAIAIDKTAEPAVVAGDVLTYALTISNTGAVTTTDLVITDVVPSGVIHPTDQTTVTWEIPELGPFGATAQVIYTVSVPITASGSITNHLYGVTAAGGYSATGVLPSVTQVVQAAQSVENASAHTLFTGISEEEGDVVIEIPAGAVFEPVLITLTQLDELASEPPDDTEWLGVAFALGAIGAAANDPDFRLSEEVTVTLRYLTVVATTQDMPALYYWNGTEWTTTDISCPEMATPGTVVCTLDGVPVGTYALFSASEPEPEPNEYTLTVTEVGEGSVAQEPDQTLYVEDDEVTLTATPAAGWRFVGWSGDIDGIENPRIITIGANTLITATFEEEEEEEEEPPTEQILIPNLQRGSQ